MAYSPSYQWNPEDYTGSSHAQKNWGNEFLKDLTFRNNDAILDIGSGDGIFTKDFAERIREGYVVGMDISPEMVRYASSHFPLSEYQNLSFI
ncbi:MAG: class I SAM-dependent methyltransferase, partial [Methanospirillum sp.]|nr:class I SAM-dependent methyltransferase [Methanospirillum sp.]